MEGLELDDPIMTALNTAVPGETLDPEAEYMVPYITVSLQQNEEQEIEVIERETEIRSNPRREGGVEAYNPSMSI